MPLDIIGFFHAIKINIPKRLKFERGHPNKEIDTLFIGFRLRFDVEIYR